MTTNTTGTARTTPKSQDELEVEVLEAELERLDREIEYERLDAARRKAALYAAGDPGDDELADITRQAEVFTAGLREERHRLEVRLLQVDKTPWEQRQADKARREWAAQEQVTRGTMVAIPSPEPLVAVYRPGPDGGRAELPVYGFTAGGSALVLDPHKHYLVPAWDTTAMGAPIEIVPPDRRDLPVTGPFTPAPPGLTVVFHDSTRIPVLYVDVHGRPLIIDPTSQLGYLEVADAHPDFDHIEHALSP